MKKYLFAAIISFVLGVAIFNIIPEQKTIVVSGDIALLNKRELINNSSVIVRGTVEDILPSKWSNPNSEKGSEVRNIVQTDIVVNIQEVYKNKPYNEEKIIVRINQGEVGNIKMISEGYPDFIPNEEIVLFLSEDDGDLANPKEKYYVLTGMLQGKFSLVDGNDSKKIFTNAKDGHGVFEKASFSLSTIRKEIDTTLNDLKINPIPQMTKEQIRINNKKIFGEYSTE